MLSLLLRGWTISLLVRHSVRLLLCHRFVYVHSTNEVIGIHIHNIDRFLSPMFLPLHPEKLETKGRMQENEHLHKHDCVLQLQNDYVHNCVISMLFKEPISKIFNYTCRSRKFSQEGGPRNFFACQGSQMSIFGNFTMLESSRGLQPLPPNCMLPFFHFNYILFQIKCI